MLSERLKTIADLIPYEETMADIGTDHGFLPVYLIETGRSPNAIATDISEGSLQKAIDLAKGKKLDNMLSTRRGDGLDVIGKAEVDNVIIAGMGGILISDILGKDIEKAKSFKRLILQPRSKIGFLRKWLRDHNFTIERETLVKELDKICEIIVAIPYEEFHDEFPFSIVNSSNKYTLEYLETHLKKNTMILDTIIREKSTTKKVLQIEDRIRHISNLIELYKAERREHEH
ncbi:MAG: class I SAM-dependent methyltransferase [Clostridiales bacterium]|nr:class I SAM-dependent methyltransferase [Clostridiales bacterium]MDY4060623.1 class I SAM-dependent methyltransferase [Anaerovoracaceae bacterium]